MRHKLDISNPQNQLKDFFRFGSSGSVELPKNPYNILWILENSNSVSPGKDEYIDVVRDFINKNDKFNNSFDFKYENPFLKIVLDEELICERLEYLVKNGASIKDEGIAIVRYNSFSILKKSIELGMDVNIYRDGNYPLRYAILRASANISEYLWDIKDINKKYKDMSGLTIIHKLIDSKSYFLLTKAWKEIPEMFLIRSDINVKLRPNITPLELFGNLPKGFFIKNSKFKTDIEEMIISLMQFYENSPLIEDKLVYDKIHMDSKFSNLIELSKKYTRERLEESLPKSNQLIKKMKL